MALPNYPYLFTQADPADMDELKPWLSEELKRVEQASKTDYENLQEFKQNAVDNFVFAGYGGGYNNTSTPLQNIGSGWQVVPLTTEVVTPARGVVFNATNNTVALQYPGAWFVNMRVSFEHNSSNSGRIVNLRVFNETDQVAFSRNFPVGTGRNAEATLIPVTSLFSISEAELNKELSMEIGGGDNYTSAIMDSAEFSLHHVGLVPLSYITGT